MNQEPRSIRFMGVAEMANRLSAAGLSNREASAKATLFARIAEAISALEQREPAGDARPLAVFVPGRIELLGKHTDYAGGHSMTVAVEQGFCMAARPRKDAWITVIDVVSGEQIRFPMSAELEPTVGDWSNYPMTVARRLARNFPGIAYGADIAFGSEALLTEPTSPSAAICRERPA
jgi:galactokinase